jgi:two-component system CheB/CheR fusion protein
LPPTRAQSPVERVVSVGELHFRMVEQYAPPSVLVNHELDIIHLSEHAGKFLTLGGGEPTKQLLRLVLPALRLDLRTAIYAARQAGRRPETRVVRFDDDGKERVVELRVVANLLDELAPEALLVIFDERDQVPAIAELRDPSLTAMVEPVVRELEDELHRTRDQLRTTVEQYETSLEELKASNEELQAINEELRSTSEELETGKEELQSVNEELTTLNQELKVKVEEITTANSDLQNLMSSTDIGVLFLDRQLRIKRFTPRLQELFNVIPTDIDRPLSDLTHRLELTDHGPLAEHVLQTLRTIDREVASTHGRRYLMRLLPYRSLMDRIEGVVVTFVDVTVLRATEAALAISEDRLAQALRIAPIIMLALAEDGSASWGFAHGKSLSPADAMEMFAPGHADRLAVMARRAVGAQAGQRGELDVVVDGTTQTYEFRVEATGSGVIAVGFDITPRKR